MEGPTPDRRRGWKRFLLVAALPGLPLLLLLVLGRGMRHEFGDLDYFSPSGERVSTPVGARRLPDFDLTDQGGRPVGTGRPRRHLLAGRVHDHRHGHHAPPGHHDPAAALGQLALPRRAGRRPAVPDAGRRARHARPVLDDYVERNERYNRYPDKWRFLTGDQTVIDRMIAEDLGVPRDSADPFNMATLLLIDDRGYVRQKYLASSEYEIGDAVEDIALLKKRKLEAEKATSPGSNNRRCPTSATREVVRWTDGSVDTLFHTVPKFALTDQLGRECSHRDVEGKVRLVDAFFTACPTICPVISSQLARVHDRLAADGISATASHPHPHGRSGPTTPRNACGAMPTAWAPHPELWRFLTGPKDDLYDLLQEGYLLDRLASDTAAGGFFHSDQILIVDTEGHIRGTYDGTKTSDVDRMLEDVYGLLARTDARPCHEHHRQSHRRPALRLDREHRHTLGGARPVPHSPGRGALGGDAAPRLLASTPERHPQRLGFHLFVRLPDVHPQGPRCPAPGAQHRRPGALGPVPRGELCDLPPADRIDQIRRRRRHPDGVFRSSSSRTSCCRSPSSPLSLFSYARGLMGDVQHHRRIAKVTMPMWLYVTATGVIVYLTTSPITPTDARASLLLLLALGLGGAWWRSWRPNASCARPGAEDSAAEGAVGRGINQGILYIMAVPCTSCSDNWLPRLQKVEICRIMRKLYACSTSLLPASVGRMSGSTLLALALSLLISLPAEAQFTAERAIDPDRVPAGYGQFKLTVEQDGLPSQCDVVLFGYQKSPTRPLVRRGGHAPPDRAAPPAHGDRPQARHRSMPSPSGPTCSANPRFGLPYAPLETGLRTDILGIHFQGNGEPPPSPSFAVAEELLKGCRPTQTSTFGSSATPMAPMAAGAGPSTGRPPSAAPRCSPTGW